MKLTPHLERMGQARHSSPVTHPSVKVHIDELVLHGFARGDRHRIAAAMETELARLMSEGGLPGLRGKSLTLGRINGGAFKVTAGAKPHATGTEIAQAVFRSLRTHAMASARAKSSKQ
jgi:hypothetical protein